MSGHGGVVGVGVLKRGGGREREQEGGQREGKKGGREGRRDGEGRREQ